MINRHWEDSKLYQTEIMFVGNVGYAFSCAGVFMRGRFVGSVGYVSTRFKLTRRFTVRVSIHNVGEVEATASGKQDAETEAARLFMEKFG